MKEPNLQKIAILSLAIHLTFLTMALAVINRSNHFVTPSPYIVSLVGTEGPTGRGQTSKSAAPEYPSEPLEQMSMEAKEKTKDKELEQYSKDRIAALEAKRRIKKAFELRKMISLKGSSDSEKASTEIGQQGIGQDTADSYAQRIGAEIHQYWAIPRIGLKGLETVISIMILKDGSVKLNKIERSSGNPLFDRSVLTAIRKASPVTPPPYEMEIGVRFTP